MNISFEGKVALVTGTGFGLGVATAKAFAQSGASVVLSDWNEKEVQAAANDFTDQGQRVLAVRCDVSDDAQVGETTSGVIKRKYKFIALSKRLSRNDDRYQIAGVAF